MRGKKIVQIGQIDLELKVKKLSFTLSASQRASNVSKISVKGIVRIFLKNKIIGHSETAGTKILSSIRNDLSPD